MNHQWKPTCLTGKKRDGRACAPAAGSSLNRRIDAPLRDFIQPFDVLFSPCDRNVPCNERLTGEPEALIELFLAEPVHFLLHNPAQVAVPVDDSHLAGAAKSASAFEGDGAFVTNGRPQQIRVLWDLDGFARGLECNDRHSDSLPWVYAQCTILFWFMVYQTQ